MKVSPQTALFFVLFVDLFAVAVVLPLIPQYAKELGVQASLYGLLGSLYGVAQLLGAPVMGSISDSYGRNVVLMISCVGTCIAYLVMGFTHSVVLFFVLRLPVGYVRQTVTAASAYISDSTGYEQRTVALGHVQMIMSASFLAGPICSGISAQKDPTLKLPIYIATVCFVLEFLALWYVLPDSRTLTPPPSAAALKAAAADGTAAASNGGGSVGGSVGAFGADRLPAVPAGHPVIKADADGKLPVPCPFSMDSGAGAKVPPAKQSAAQSMVSFWAKLRANMQTLVRYVHDPVMATYLLTFFVFTFTLTAYRESLVISLQNRFDLTGAHVGYIWGYVAFLGMVVQGVAIAPLTTRWSEEQLTGVCLVGLAVSHVFTGLAPTFKVWCAVMPAVALFGGVLRTCVVGSLTKTVARAQVGAMLGLTDFLTSVCRVICPFFGGVLTQFTGANSTDYVVSILSVAMALYLRYDAANNGSLSVRAAAAAKLYSEQPQLALQPEAVPLKANGAGAGAGDGDSDGDGAADGHAKSS